MAIVVPCSKSVLLFLITILISLIIIRENYLDTSASFSSEKSQQIAYATSINCERAYNNLDNEKCTDELFSARVALESLKNLTRELTMNKTLAWGASWESNKTGGHIETTVIHTNCLLPGTSMHVCCAAVDPSLGSAGNNKPVGIGMTSLPTAHKQDKSDTTTSVNRNLQELSSNSYAACVISKIYSPSPYEVEQLAFARHLASEEFAGNSSAR